MAKKVTGGCACRSIRYQLLDKPMFVHCCHCDDCQRLTGSAFVLNAIIETQAIKLLRGKPVAVPVPRENGLHDIYRCPRCQTAQAQSPVRAHRNARRPRRVEAGRAHLHPVESKVAQAAEANAVLPGLLQHQQALAQGQPQTPQRSAR